MIQASEPGLRRHPRSTKRRSPGVVTIRSVFGSRRGRRLRLRPQRRRRNRHQRPRRHRRIERRPRGRRSRSTSSSRTATSCRPRSSASTPSSTSPCCEIEPDGFDLHPLELGDDRDLRVGQPVAAIGSPFGEQQSLSVGVVSATDRSVQSLTQFEISGAIQTDASINPGNSGGPLLDAGARVVGINQQIETNSGANDGVGFAVPISAIKRSIAQLRRGRRGRIRLHRRLQPAALSAAAAQARPRHHLRRPRLRSQPRRPGGEGRDRGGQRQTDLPGRPIPDRRRRDPAGRRP